MNIESVAKWVFRGWDALRIWKANKNIQKDGARRRKEVGEDSIKKGKENK